MRRSRIFAVTLALAMVFMASQAVFAGGGKQQGAGEERYVMLLKTFSNEYWSAMKEGIEQWAKENNVLVDVVAATSESDFNGQLSQLEDLIRKEYAGIGVAPLSPVNLIPGIVQANKKGIPIIDVDEPVDFNQLRAAGGSLLGNYTTDNVMIGRRGGEYIVKTIGSGSKAAILLGTGGNITGELRAQGAREAMQAGGVSVVATQPADYDRVKALDVSTNIMQANPDVKAFYCCNDTMALGVQQAIQNLKKEGQVIVVGTDAVPSAIESIKSGGMAATVGQDPAGIGIACLKDLIAAHKNGFKADPKADIPVKYIDSFLVTKDNAK